MYIVIRIIIDDIDGIQCYNNYFTDISAARAELRNNYYYDCRINNFDEQLEKSKNVLDDYHVVDYDASIELIGKIIKVEAELTR